MLGWEPVDASIERETGRYLLEVLFGGMAMDSLSSTWEANDIAEGATVSLQLGKTFLEEVVRDIVDLNPHLTVKELMRVTFEADRRTLQSWDLFRKGLTALPESFGSLSTVGGDLNLYQNQLRTLPESFASLTVGGYLRLNENQLTTLPESFGSLTVGEDLGLYYNQLTTLPESFGSLTVGGDLYIDLNLDLTALPGFTGEDLDSCFPNVKGEVKFEADDYRY